MAAAKKVGKKKVTTKIIDATPERIASKAKQAMEFQNSLEGINEKAGIENVFRLTTEADVISALDVTGVVAKKIIEVIKVVIKNFLAIFGFFGAPGSFPLKSSLNSIFSDFIPIGRTEKKLSTRCKYKQW